jgi:hypothetical protein
MPGPTGDLALSALDRLDEVIEDLQAVLDDFCLPSSDRTTIAGLPSSLTASRGGRA